MRLLLDHSAAGKKCCGADEVCACKLSERLGLAESTISHHMSVLKKAGLVSARKDGTWVYYTVQHTALAEVSRAIAEMGRE
jgi:ArsR family transcriptional regulator